MKNIFKLSSLLFVGLVFMQVSCSDDAEEPTVDPLVGKWAMSGAIFNTTTEDPADVMMIENFGVQGNTLEVPTGASILELVVGRFSHQ